jgi:cellulose synthase/poly-beta-1,6-N-acetylglucosamine synthase-like glycosyltransferase
LPTKPIRAIYHSATHANVRVIDKDNGGKADSLNAGINLSIYPLFCCIDADSILQRDSLRRVVQPFLNDHHTVACGGTVRIANGCRVDNGLLTHVRLPSNVLALFQIVEYLRAFLFGRLGWSPLNAMLIISGAFGLFHKDSVVTVGGYRSDTIGEDMELVVRLHRHFRLSGQPYRITYVPDPVCWTEAPEDLRTLQNQRIRWQRGLCDSLTENLDLCCHPKGGTVGWLAFPFMALFEWLGPAIEVFGYGSLLAGFLLGYVSFETWLILVTAAIGLGVLLSLSALLLEEMSFHIYPKQMDLLKLVCAAIAENFGYRQLNSCWKLIGLYRWMRGSEASWGTMIRNATWDVR